MTGYIRLLYRLRWLVALGVPLVVLFLSSYLKHLEIDGSYRIWFEKDAPVLKTYDNFRNAFSNDDGVTIIFRDPNGIFNQKALGTVMRITEALWDMDRVDRVDSITNYQYVHADPAHPDEVLVDDFIDDIDEVNASYLADRKQIATNDSIVVNSFVSKDGTTTMIFARLEPDANEEGNVSGEIMKAVHAIVDPEANRTGYKFWLNGGPAITQAFVEIAGNDAATFTPLVLLIAMVLLFALFRRVSGALIPVGVVLFTFLAVIAIQVLLGYKLNNFTANIPVFIIAIGIADAVHIYSVWRMQRQAGEENYRAVEMALSKNFLPIFLTSATTMVGFATLALSKVVPVATLGIATASGALLAFLISVTWMPAVLFLLARAHTQHEPQEKQRSVRPVRYGAFIVRHNRQIVLVSVGIMLLLGAGLWRIEVDSNTIRYFDKKVEIRKSSEFNMAHLTGPMSYTLIIDSGRKDGIKDPAFLKTVERFSMAYQKHFPHDVRHISSLLDVIKRYNKIFNATETVPNRRDLIAQYLLLYSTSLKPGMEITDKIDFDQRKFRITVLTNIVDTSKDLEMIHFAQQWWAKTPYTMEITGQTVMYAFMQDDITDTLIWSLSLTLLIVSVMLLVIFRRVKLLWILMLPNILPVVLVLGVMGWLGLTIDMGVAIAGAIIIGVAVDDTIHFLAKYFDARKRGLSMAESFDEVLQYAGRAILFTTVVLSFSFAVFLFSDFVPNRNFGIVTAVALAIALLADLLLLPALLSMFDTKSYTVSKE